MLSASVSEALIGFVRDSSFIYREDLALKNMELKYGARDREALVTLVQGVLSGNQNLRRFSVEGMGEECWRNAQGFVEGCGDVVLGQNLRDLELNDSFLYAGEGSMASNFLAEGTRNL